MRWSRGSQTGVRVDCTRDQNTKAQKLTAITSDTIAATQRASTFFWKTFNHFTLDKGFSGPYRTISGT